MVSESATRNLIRIFDADTERLIESIEIPAHRKADLFEVMGWLEPEDEIFVYDLSDYQLRVIGQWLGRDLASTLWAVQIAGVAP